MQVQIPKKYNKNMACIDNHVDHSKITSWIGTYSTWYLTSLFCSKWKRQRGRGGG
jgi:hypothetical protein